MSGEALPITGTGEETRDWTFVEDIVDGLLRAGSNEMAVGKAFNLASGRETRVIDVANWINEETGNSAGIHHIKKRKWDTKDRALASIEKANEHLGYEPKTEFREGLRKTIDWFQSNWKEIQASAKF